MTTTCLNCRRVIFEAHAIEHCRDGVVVGHTCSPSMQKSCEALMRERHERPFYWRSMRRVARTAIAASEREKSS